MKSNAGRPTKYPWDKWLSKTTRAFTLNQGKDYDCQTNSMQIMFRMRAAKAGLGCSIQMRKNSLYIKLTKEG